MRVKWIIHDRICIDVHVIFSKKFRYPGSVHTCVCDSCILLAPPGFLARVVAFVVAVVAISSIVNITSIVAIVVVHRRYHYYCRRYPY